MEYKDYYKILGVSKNADEKAVKTAYRKLARQYHPDQNPDDPTAEDKFKDINEAYEVLGDKENRSKYDQLGANYHRYKQRGGDPRGFDYSQYANGQNINMNDLNDLFGDQAGFSDFFSSMFGGDAPGGRPRAQPLRQDSEQDIEITLEEAFHGASRTLVDANGNRFTVKIPKGAKDGTKVRLRGKGSRGGDLYLITKIRTHTVYSRDEADPKNLRSSIEVDALTAILGGQARVETLKGAVNLKVLPGTQGGRTVRLRGRGMPDLKQNDRFGDLYAEIRIAVPTQLSDEERQLYEQLRALRAVAEPEA